MSKKITQIIVLIFLFLNFSILLSQNSIIIKLKNGYSESLFNQAIYNVKANYKIDYKLVCIVDDKFKKQSFQNSSALLLSNYFVVNSYINNFSVLISELNNLNLLEKHFQNHIYKIDKFLNDSGYNQQWALKKIEAENAWKISKGDSTTKIGFIDTGVDYFHQDLKKNLRVNFKEDLNKNGTFEPWSYLEKRNNISGDFNSIDDDNDGFTDNVLGYDFVDQTVINIGDSKFRDPDPLDENGHGTNIAGILAAEQNNNIGISGIAPSVSIIPLRAFDATGNGEDDDISAAIIYAADHGINVLNLSFGDYYYSPLMKDAIEYALSRGVVCVAASGNNGGTTNHYPSNYDNIISVGMTSEDDYVHPFSTGGSRISMCAPGVGILTTSIGNLYKSVTGTSSAAPHVAAACAILKSIHKDWNYKQIKATLELTTDDIQKSKWDEYGGAGRLNLRRALELNTPSIFEIISPLHFSGINLDTNLLIIGTINTALFDNYKLYWGYGDVPNIWNDISYDNIGKVNANLGSVHLKFTKDTLITIRLVVNESNGRSNERRVLLFVQGSKTEILSKSIDTLFANDKNAVSFKARTSNLTRMYFYFKPRNSNLNFRLAEHESERITGFVKNHYLLLTSNDLIPNLEYNCYVVFQDSKGDTVNFGNEKNPFFISRNDYSFPITNFIKKKYSLPYGFLLDDVTSIYSDEKSTVLMNKFEEGNFSKLMTFQFENNEFILKDSSGVWVPRGVGFIDKTNKKAILCQALNKGIVFQQSEKNSNPFSKVIYSDTSSRNFTPSTFYDFDSDGVNEIVAYSSDSIGPFYGIYKLNGDLLTRLVSLKNNTKPAPDQRENIFSSPDVAIADFNNNGKVDILIGDEDGDFFIYEMESINNFKEIWKNENNGVSGGSFISKCDIDGDKINEFIIGYKSNRIETIDNEYEPLEWTIKILKLDKQNNESKIWEKKFAYIRSELPFRSGVTAFDIDADKGDEIIFSVAPNFYIFKYDSQSKNFRPFWYKSSGLSNKPLVYDFDKNGLPEISVGNGNEYNFYELKSSSIKAPIVSGLQSWSISNSKIYVSWSKTKSAISYKLLRAEYDFTNPPINFSVVNETSENELIDSLNLKANTYYIYIVLALYNDGTIESDPSNSSISYTHNPIKIQSIEYNQDKNLKISFDNFIKEELYRNGIIEINSLKLKSNLQVSSVNYSSEKSLNVTLKSIPENDILTVSSTEIFKDFYNSPADTSKYLIEIKNDTVRECFKPVKAGRLNSNKFFIIFNEEVDDSTYKFKGNYSINPETKITSIEKNKDSILVTIDNAISIGALGLNYFITVQNLLSKSSKNLCKSNSIGFAFSEINLDNVFVFPQPLSITKNQFCTFGNLTNNSVIEIYSNSGELINSLKEAEGNGGFKWDGKNLSGEIVKSGIYLYRVVNYGTDNLELKNSGWKKIVIVP